VAEQLGLDQGLGQGRAIDRDEGLVGAPRRAVQGDGGTLFLDEIGDMPLSAQTRLLRVLAEREVTALGERGRSGPWPPR
jgi:transcriptional regulator of acetoin/glycerol metabolism